MANVVMPAGRIDSSGEIRNIDSPYEEGVYFSVIGLSISDNPYDQEDKFNFRRFRQGFNDHKSGKLNNGDKGEK